MEVTGLVEIMSRKDDDMSRVQLSRIFHVNGHIIIMISISYLNIFLH